MNLKLFISIYFCTFLANMANSQDTGADKTSDFDSIISNYAAKGFSGSVLLCLNGKKLISKGIGKPCPESEKTINADSSVFEIGSTSKQFTTTAILMLAEKGKLDIADNLEKYFPGIPSDKKKITLSQLMSNTSGLQTYHDKDGAFEKISREEAQKRIFKQKLKFSPGEKYSYSNSGFTILAMVIEEITGQPFRKFMHDSVFSKAGLSQTGFMGEKIWNRENVVCGTGFSRKGHPYDWNAMTWAELGAGNMVSSVKDYGIWLQALLGEKIISRENLQKLVGEYVKYTDITDEAYYGFGWIILKHPKFGKIIYHNGGEQFGFISTVRVYEEPGCFLIILCNNFDHQPHEMFQLRKEIETVIFR